jgi:hypothetical protein
VNRVTREQKYTQQLKEMGIYRPAFDPEIRELADLERDRQRIRKEWKSGGSKGDSKLYPLLLQMRREILTHRDALGLTPRGYKRLAGNVIEEPEDERKPATVLGFVLDKRAGQA